MSDVIKGNGDRLRTSFIVARRHFTMRYTGLLASLIGKRNRRPLKTIPAGELLFIAFNVEPMWWQKERGWIVTCEFLRFDDSPHGCHTRDPHPLGDFHLAGIGF